MDLTPQTRPKLNAKKPDLERKLNNSQPEFISISLIAVAVIRFFTSFPPPVVRSSVPSCGRNPSGTIQFNRLYVPIYYLPCVQSLTITCYLTELLPRLFPSNRQSFLQFCSSLCLGDLFHSKVLDSFPFSQITFKHKN